MLVPGAASPDPWLTLPARGESCPARSSRLPCVRRGRAPVTRVLGLAIVHIPEVSRDPAGAFSSSVKVPFWAVVAVWAAVTRTAARN